MSKIGFNDQTIGRRDKPDGHVCHAVDGCAFEPVVVFQPGIEAIMEGIRLANIQGFKPPVPNGPAKDVDP